MNPPKTDEELDERLAAFVDRVLVYAQPGNLPLRPEIQSIALQSIIYQAAELKNSEPFLRRQILRAAVRLNA